VAGEAGRHSSSQRVNSAPGEANGKRVGHHPAPLRRTKDLVGSGGGKAEGEWEAIWPSTTEISRFWEGRKE